MTALSVQWFNQNITSLMGIIHHCYILEYDIAAKKSDIFLYICSLTVLLPEI